MDASVDHAEPLGNCNLVCSSAKCATVHTAREEWRDKYRLNQIKPKIMMNHESFKFD